MRRMLRPIDLLRRDFPGEWSWDARSCVYHGPDGLRAHFESLLSPRYEGDDENCVMQLRVGTEDDWFGGTTVYTQWGRIWCGSRLFIEPPRSREMQLQAAARPRRMSKS